MNMIKKLALGLSTVAVSSALVACGDSGGGSVSEITITPSSTGWTVDGVVTAENNIFDVKFKLAKGDSAIVGAVYAYTIKEVNPDTTQALLEVNLGKAAGNVPGLETEIFKSDLGGACGTLTLTVAAVVEGSGALGGANGEAVELEPVVTEFEVTCGDTSTPAGPDIDIPNIDSEASLTTKKSVDLGGAKSSLGSSLDLDGEKIYTSSELKQLTSSGKEEIDVIFSGSLIMTPYGTAEGNYFSKTFSGVNNGVLFYKVDATKAAAATTVDEMLNLIDDYGNFLMVSSVSKGDAFVVLTNKGVPFLVIVDALDATSQVVTLKYAKEKAE